LIITSFVLGMGLGTLVAGPLSDAFGRKPVIVLGLLLHMVASVICFAAPSLETMLLARVLQGLGAAGPRTVAIAMVRDQFQGRQMARVMSFVMMVFTLVPAVAPLMGQAVIHLSGWRAIFLVYLLFAIVVMAWLGLRQPETLPPTARRPLALRALIAGSREVLLHRIVLVSIAAQALTLAALFATLSSTQGIFDQRFERGAEFPKWFALIALLAGTTSLLNSQIVVRLGMRKVVTRAYLVQVIATLALLGALKAGLVPEALAFPAHLIWTIGVFGIVGLTLGNLNALAMEHLGHIAGLAASVTSALATVLSVVLAVPVGLAFDGTVFPLMIGVAVFSGASLWLMRLAPR
jgi:MFS transporter, DHA1 family, multidrug resistance protein